MMIATDREFNSSLAPDVADADLFTRLRYALGDGVTVSRRNLMHIRHVPEKLLDVTLQPVIFVLLFTFVFGAAIKLHGQGHYQDFLMAGIFVQQMAFAAMGTAVSMSEDRSNGVIDRFRALPMARSAVLSGRTLADLAANLLGLTVIVAAGLAVGWRPHAGTDSIAAGFALLLLFGYAMSWLGTLVGMWVRTTDAAQALGFILLFPMTFLSNAFVPTNGMVPWLRTVANWNPVSAMVAASRKLLGNPTGAATPNIWPLQHAVPVAFAWVFGILLVSLIFAIRRYDRMMRG